MARFAQMLKIFDLLQAIATWQGCCDGLPLRWLRVNVAAFTETGNFDWSAESFEASRNSVSHVTVYLFSQCCFRS
jgi:hypothetical protein